jgi:hypothetical protein
VPSPSLARAYLAQRRRKPFGPVQGIITTTFYHLQFIHLTYAVGTDIVAIVRDSNGTPVQYGLPCDWEDGIAQQVLQRILQV